jgi:hypothetical protein
MEGLWQTPPKYCTKSELLALFASEEARKRIKSDAAPSQAEKLDWG